MDSQQLFEHNLQAAQIEQGGARDWVDQHIEIACFGVAAVKHGPKEAWVSGAIALHELANLAPVKSQCLRWLQDGGYLGIQSRILYLKAFRRPEVTL